MKHTNKSNQKARAKNGRKPVREQRLARRTKLEPSAERTTTGGAERSGRLVGEPLPALPSIPHARKMLYDYMDSKRPWATCKDVYVMMEAIVDYAAFAFRHEHRPTKEEVRERDDWLMKLTAPLDEHPEGYELPCACAECRSYGD